MNVKVHIPKNMKRGETMKQFLLSLVATTISIVLTFGTAAWLDERKKNEAGGAHLLVEHRDHQQPTAP